MRRQSHVNPFENLASQRYTADERVPKREANTVPTSETGVASGTQPDLLQAGKRLLSQQREGPHTTPTPKDGPESLRWVGTITRFVVVIAHQQNTAGLPAAGTHVLSCACGIFLGLISCSRRRRTISGRLHGLIYMRAQASRGDAAVPADAAPAAA